MKISWQTLQRFFGKNLPGADKLEAIFTFGAFEVEGVEKYQGKNDRKNDIKNGKKFDDTSDTVIDLKVLPDRACYALSWQGIAYELSALTGIALLDEPFSANIPRALHQSNGQALVVPIADLDRQVIINVDQNADCNRQFGQFIEGIDSRHSPEWLATELDKVGQRSISAIVDITNYVTLFMGQPLHAFDADKIKGPIHIRKANANETITLLDSSVKTLNETVTVISDDIGPLDVAGVKGGKRAEVSADTTRIILVASSFDPVSIRKASTKIGIKNDASKRFENNISPRFAGIGLSYATTLIAHLFENAKFGPVADIVINKEPATKGISISIETINNALGSELSSKEIISPLKSLYFDVDDSKDNSNGLGQNLTITAPFWRRDIVIPEDIFEEVGRVVGYDKIHPTIPPVPAQLPKINPAYYVTEWIKNILVSKGFSEVMLYTLGNEGYYETAYPIASDKSFLRANLSKHMKTCLENNAKHVDYLGIDDIMIFEIGKVFDGKNSGGVDENGEHLHLSIAVSISKQTKKKHGITPSDLVLQTLDTISKTIGYALQGQVSSKDMHAWAEVSLDSAIAALGAPGKLPADYSSLNFANSNKVCVANYVKISPYPYAIRDAAFFVSGATDDSLKDELADLIRVSAGPNLVSVRLFDVFTKTDETKSTNDAGVTSTAKILKTSYAFRLVFQSYEKTLSEGEITSAMNTVYGALKGKCYEIR